MFGKKSQVRAMADPPNPVTAPQHAGRCRGPYERSWGLACAAISHSSLRFAGDATRCRASETKAAFSIRDDCRPADRHVPAGMPVLWTNLAVSLRCRAQSRSGRPGYCSRAEASPRSDGMGPLPATPPRCPSSPPRLARAGLLSQTRPQMPWQMRPPVVFCNRRVSRSRCVADSQCPCC